jgi:hypothetical protein
LFYSAVDQHFLIARSPRWMQICEDRGGSPSISIQFLSPDLGRSNISGGLFPPGESPRHDLGVKSGEKGSHASLLFNRGAHGSNPSTNNFILVVQALVV